MPSPAPKKSLGQHFLRDAQAIRRICAAIPAGSDILEIGPGPGAMTESLLKQARRLCLIEMDDRFAAAWTERSMREPHLSVVHGDVMQCLEETVAAFQPQWIAGNLPYNLSGPLTAKLAALKLAGGMVLMYQREVADRIAAEPGSKVYGGLSVLVRHHYQVRRLLVLPPGAFSPPPKVHSAVILLTPHGRKPRCSFASLQSAVRLAFAHRRKTIANNLRGRLNAEDLEAIGIDPGLRPEQLDYDAFSRIAIRLASRSG